VKLGHLQYINYVIKHKPITGRFSAPSAAEGMYSRPDFGIGHCLSSIDRLFVPPDDCQLADE